MKTIFCQVLLTSAIAFAADQSAGPKADPAKTPAKKEAAQVKKGETAKPAPTAPAMQVYRDPKTGQFGTPPADALPSAQVAIGAQSEDVPVTQNPDGSYTAVLPESARVQVMATRNADGTVSLGETHGASAQQNKTPQGKTGQDKKAPDAKQKEGK